MSIQAVIFDLDGVLCSTDHYHYLAWSEIARKLHIPFDARVNDRLRGVSRAESLEIILEAYHGSPLSGAEKQALMEEKNNFYRQLLRKMTPEDQAEGASTVLTRLHEKGLKLAVGSSSKNAGFILEKIGLTSYFDGIADGNCITKSKPDPEVFMTAASMIAVPPEDCLVVEDALSGVEAGERAGMKVAYLNATAENIGSYCICSLADLLKIL